MSTIDSDGTGQVDFQEFLSAAHETPLLLEAFEQLLVRRTTYLFLLSARWCHVFLPTCVSVAGCWSHEIVANMHFQPSPALLKKHVDGLNKIPPGDTFDWNRLNDMSVRTYQHVFVAKNRPI
jgi:hypothetical protein